jgi:basic amino acid/polyamine antiporter, APA family
VKRSVTPHAPADAVRSAGAWGFEPVRAGAEIGFSSFAVLVCYAIANAAAWTLGGKVVPTLGLIGCLVLAFALPVTTRHYGRARSR